VRNYEGESNGAATIDDALAQSINTVFAELILEIEPPNVVKTAEAAGIANPDRPLEDDRYRPAIALGGLRHGVTPLEMAAAYATFAAKGTYARPYAIAKIADRSGRPVYTAHPQTTSAFDPKEVGVLNAAMMQVVQRGTGTAARIGRPVAGKTGTTQNYGDAWFVGFVPQLSTAVWVGNPDRIEPMTAVHGRRVSGGSFPAQIWAQMMRSALAGEPALPIHTATPDSLGLRTLGSSTTFLTTTSGVAPSSTTSSISPTSTRPSAPSSSTPGQGTTATTKPKPTTTRPATTTTEPQEERGPGQPEQVGPAP
jgi:penicillin-binding protein 1A